MFYFYRKHVISNCRKSVTTPRHFLFVKLTFLLIRKRKYCAALNAPSPESVSGFGIDGSLVGSVLRLPLSLFAKRLSSFGVLLAVTDLTVCDCFCAHCR